MLRSVGMRAMFGDTVIYFCFILFNKKSSVQWSDSWAKGDTRDCLVIPFFSASSFSARGVTTVIGDRKSCYNQSASQ